ncbi:MAG: Rha family transcriptional regulator [Deltaproteobacteria bacterium]|nr:Rha family transcriptional regulator [Deltaproteobacteria bacterium]
MEKLVFLEPDDVQEVPFTTSEVIAEHGKVAHDTVQRLIRNYRKDIEEFGIIGFEIRKTKSGRGRPEKIYRLNEEQATLLITYMQNTLPVRKFKKALVKQFYIMQKELTSRKVTREIGKEAREALTNAIQALPESPHKSMKYKHYTDLAYKVVFGKNAKQLREEYGLGKNDNLRNRFSASELDKVLKVERQISVLIELGYSYHDIKAEISRKYLISA